MVKRMYHRRRADNLSDAGLKTFITIHICPRHPGSRESIRRRLATFHGTRTPAGISCSRPCHKQPDGSIIVRSGCHRTLQLPYCLFRMDTDRSSLRSRRGSSGHAHGGQPIPERKFLMNVYSVVNIRQEKKPLPYNGHFFAQMQGQSENFLQFFYYSFQTLLYCLSGHPFHLSNSLM